MPFPAEIYIGKNTTTRVLIFVQNGYIKLFQPEKNRLILCKSISSLNKFQIDNTTLFRLLFIGMKPLILHSIYRQQIQMELYASITNNPLNLKYSTDNLQIFPEHNQFELQPLNIEIDFELQQLKMNNQVIQKTQIYNFNKSFHELIHLICINDKSYGLKFDDFGAAHSFYTMLQGFLLFQVFANDDIAPQFDVKLGKLQLDIPELE
ncbi:Hypothetical_protein [Hexamita inflata]|uniref:Hypothetical_protein n=1 Tax=Hexamita inflata TaxID=28002 RepID=A0AA86NTA5_9EUKA|nr:Hypothetical protein HINF_LOCUS12489 [Hexamita inflata]